jgi:predicted ribosome quality control (RQC) complex YloA/Tae2 family protein
MNARINSVSLVGFDRIFEFRLDAFDEMGFARTLYLYAECIRKQSNIVLCGADKRIIAALKTVDFSMSESRQVLNGFEYIPPLIAGDKINPLEADDITPALFCKEGGSAEPGVFESADLPVWQWLLSKYTGLSPLITREVAFKASKSQRDALISTGAVDKQALGFYFGELIEKIRNNNFTPVLLFDENGEKGGLVDFSYTDIRQYGNKTVSKVFDSMNGLVDFYFSKKDRDNRLKQKSQDIFKVLANANSRLNKKIKLLGDRLKDCETKENIRIYGDLITANIYRLEKGAEEYSVENYYETQTPAVSDGTPFQKGALPIVEIPADKNLTPAQNAQKYYKRYNKLKSAEYHLAKQTELARDDIAYIDSVFESLTRALSERELSEIRAELTESGFMKPLKPGKTAKTGKTGKTGRKPPKQLPVSKPEEYKSANGFRILCGRNNKQNDDLTFRIASKNDLWFHAQKIPGSHVVLMCGNTGRTPGDKDIEDAAKIAAAYSKGKNMPLVPVDYTYARYVKKPGGAKPGFVTYVNFKTAVVKPEKRE